MKKRIENPYHKKILFLFLVLISVLTISIGYSALNTSLNISGDLSLRIAADIRITNMELNRVVDGAYETYSCNYSKDTTINYTTLPASTSVADYKATVTNYSNKRYELKEIVVLNYTNSDEVSYYLEGLTEGDIIEPGTSVDFIIKVLPVIAGELLDNDSYSTTLELKYVFEEYIPPAADIYLRQKILMDNGGTDAISAKGRPNLASTSTTDDGMYATTDNDGTTYYFRGAVKNNYVYFAGFYWRIVRINGNGSIRLVYQGTTAKATAAATAPSTTKYNNDTVLLSKKPAHLLVKYYESLTIQSLLYSAANSWYESNLNAYSDFLDYEAGYCNDISTTSGTYGDYTNDKAATFSGKTRLTNKAPTLECPSESYITTNAASTGTKKLQYPSAVLTMDDVYFAGGANSNNTSYYLYTGQAYWTMTPYEFVYTLFGLSKSANVMYVDANGKITGGVVDGVYGYRPVINLKADLYYSDGDGTVSSPYTIKTKKKVDPTPYQNNKSIAETVKTLYNEGDDFIYHHDGTIPNGLNDGSYRYSGADPNNYICFGSSDTTCPAKNLYRIISVIDENVKIVSADYVTTEMLGTNAGYIGLSTSSDSTYKGDQTQSQIARYAYNNSKGNNSPNDWPGPLGETNMEVNFLNQFADTWKSKILDTVWHHNVINYFQAILNKPAAVYNIEMEDTNSTTKDGVKTQAKIGTIYNYEYGFAASSGSWGRGMTRYSNTDIVNNNWLYLGKKEWTISHGTGGDGKYAAAINSSGNIGYQHVYEGLPLRVTFSIDGTMMYTKGIGTKDNPFRIS